MDKFHLNLIQNDMIWIQFNPHKINATHVLFNASVT